MPDLPGPCPYCACLTPPPPWPPACLQISALHIESALLEHPAIGEVAVLGLPDEAYGEVGTRLAAPGAPLSCRPACMDAFPPDC